MEHWCPQEWRSKMTGQHKRQQNLQTEISHKNSENGNKISVLWKKCTLHILPLLPLPLFSSRAATLASKLRSFDCKSDGKQSHSNYCSIRPKRKPSESCPAEVNLCFRTTNQKKMITSSPLISSWFVQILVFCSAVVISSSVTLVSSSVVLLLPPPFFSSVVTLSSRTSVAASRSVHAEHVCDFQWNKKVVTKFSIVLCRAVTQILPSFKLV